MGRKPNYYTQIISSFLELHKKHPTFNLGRHISTALSDYPDVWGISDKEFLFAIQKYTAQLEYDFPHEEDEDLEKIIKEGINLKGISSILEDEDN